MSRLPQKVTICQVGLPDGVQSVSRALLTAQKCAWITQAFQAGLSGIEVGSFVPAIYRAGLPKTMCAQARGGMA
ncbi:MAG TPA: hypothetical protein VNE58_03520 [Casimicrobiaceae bacterium]|nr:hypothetical protein [Casimicrobiaceae bacterium]